MSDFKFFCPECGQKIAYDETYSGLPITCPACQKSVVAPPVLAAVAQSGPAIPVSAGSSAPRPISAPEKRPAPPSAPVRAATSKISGSILSANVPLALAVIYPCLAFVSLVAALLFALKSIPPLVLAWAVLAFFPMFFVRINDTRPRRLAALGLKASCVGLGLLILSLITVTLTKHYLAPRIVIRESQDELDALKPRIVDEVLTGDSESEEAHQLGGEHLLTGPFDGKFWRSAVTGGSITYVMKVLPDQAMSLNCRYWGSEQAGRTFDICIDDEIIATQNLEYNVPGHFFDAEYRIPRSLTRGKTQVTVAFQAHPGLAAGGLFGCQILKR